MDDERSGLERRLGDMADGYAGADEIAAATFREAAGALAECRRAMRIVDEAAVEQVGPYQVSKTCDCTACRAVRAVRTALAKLEGGDRGNEQIGVDKG